MTKAQAIKALKGFYNSDTFIGGYKIAHCGWKNKPWMVIEDEETFEDAKLDNFVPIDMFSTRQELLDIIFKKYE